MTKTITIGLVAIAFVAGSILTGTMAYAGGDDDDGGNAIVDALNQIAIAIQGIDPTVNVDPTPVNVNVDVPPAEVQVVGLEGPTGPQGLQGEQGIPGLPGADGATGPAGGFGDMDVYYDVSSPIILAKDETKSATILCGPGDIALSGGHTASFSSIGGKILTPDDQTSWAITTSTPTGPSNAPDGWIARVINTGNAEVRFNTYVVCANTTP